MSLALVSATPSTIRPALGSQPNDHANLLRLRGGLLSVPPVAVATFAATLGSAGGAYCGFATDSACTAYGITNPSFGTKTMFRALCCVNLSQGALGLAALYGAPSNVAVGVAQLPLLAGTLGATVGGLKEKMSFKAFSLPLLFSLSFATMLSAFTVKHTRVVTMVFAALTLANGVYGALAPGKLAAAWGMTGDRPLVGMVQNIGNQLCGYAVLTYLISTGMPAAKAVGASWMVALIALLHMCFIRKTHDDMGVNKQETVYPWLVTQPLVIAFTLL